MDEWWDTFTFLSRKVDQVFSFALSKNTFPIQRMLTALAEGSSQKQQVKAVKSASFEYAASGELFSLFEDFRLMCNDAIRIALKERARSRFNLIELAYPRLKEYGLHTHYILSACEVAYSVYRNNNRKSYPYITKAFLKLDNQSYQLNHLLLRIPTTPRHFVFLSLKGSAYHSSFVDDPSLKRGSITITDRAVSIAFSKEAPLIERFGYVGIDINEKNVTISATNGYKHAYTDIGEVAEIKEIQGHQGQDRKVNEARQQDCQRATRQVWKEREGPHSAKDTENH